MSQPLFSFRDLSFAFSQNGKTSLAVDRILSNIELREVNIHSPWIGFTKFATKSLMLSLLVFIGEAVRDAFDPRKSFK